MNWDMWYRIVLDLVFVLVYFYDECVFWVLYRDIKFNNVFLDYNLIVYFFDFGLVCFLGDIEIYVIMDVVGMFGYVVFEYVMICCFFDKVDVYSYGVFLFEFLFGRRVSGDLMFFSYGDGFNIVGWVIFFLYK